MIEIAQQTVEYLLSQLTKLKHLANTLVNMGNAITGMIASSRMILTTVKELETTLGKAEIAQPIVEYLLRQITPALKYVHFSNKESAQKETIALTNMLMAGKVETAQPIVEYLLRQTTLALRYVHFSNKGSAQKGTIALTNMLMTTVQEQETTQGKAEIAQQIVEYLLRQVTPALRYAITFNNTGTAKKEIIVSSLMILTSVLIIVITIKTYKRRTTVSQTSVSNNHKIKTNDDNHDHLNLSNL